MMPNVDQWLDDASHRLAVPLGIGLFDRIDQRLANEPAPQILAGRRDSRRAMLCAGLAAIIGFGIAGTSTSVALARPAPTWVAAPPAASPFGLLVGR